MGHRTHADPQVMKKLCVVSTNHLTQSCSWTQFPC